MKRICLSFIVVLSLLMSTLTVGASEGIEEKSIDRMNQAEFKIDLTDKSLEESKKIISSLNIDITDEAEANQTGWSESYGEIIVEYIKPEANIISDISKNQFNTLKASNNLDASQIRLVTINKEFTSDWERVDNPVLNKGMDHWLDVTFNIAVGTKTKYVWKAATILGLNPSNFYTYRQQGDNLSKMSQKIYTYRCVQVKTSSGWTTTVSSQRIYLYAYASATSWNPIDGSVNETKYKLTTSYADHYFDDEYLVNRAKELYSTYGILGKETYYAD